MIGTIKKHEQIIGNLEKVSEKIVYKSDHRLVDLNYANGFMKTTPKIAHIVYESEETE